MTLSFPKYETLRKDAIMLLDAQFDGIPSWELYPKTRTLANMKAPAKTRAYVPWLDKVVFEDPIEFIRGRYAAYNFVMSIGALINEAEYNLDLLHMRFGNFGREIGAVTSKDSTLGAVYQTDIRVQGITTFELLMETVVEYQSSFYGEKTIVNILLLNKAIFDFYRTGAIEPNQKAMLKKSRLVKRSKFDLLKKVLQDN